MRKRFVWIGAFLSLFLAFWFLWQAPAVQALTEEQQLFAEAWRAVSRSYIDDTFNHQNWWFVRQRSLRKPFPDREATYRAIEKMLASLGDPFTRFLRPKQYRSLQTDTAGELTGVGLRIALDRETQEIEVIAPIAGSPADAAGIQSRDRIVAIDGTKASALSLEDAAGKMRGPAGSEVTLTVRSHENNEVRDFELVRGTISLNPITAHLRPEENGLIVGYIRLSQFNGNATEEMARAIARFERAGANAYILDLRNNPGGLLRAGIEVARLWIDRGAISYTVNRQGVLSSFDANETALTDDPLVVLTNGGTASSSEILAGALQDSDRALLVGEKTFGKGLIQSLFELSDGSGLAVTVAKYETPNHRDINKRGIEPDVIVPYLPSGGDRLASEDDPQYRKAIEVLAQNG